MKIETKFDIGQEVWNVKNNILRLFIIKVIVIDKFSDMCIRYADDHCFDDQTIYYDENDCYATREEAEKAKGK